MTKKLRMSLIAAVLSLCLLFAAAAIALCLPASARAENGLAQEQTAQGGVASNSSATAEVTLSDAADFTYDSTDNSKITGLSDEGKAKISEGQYFELIIPANVTQIFADEFEGNDKLVKLSFAENSHFTTFDTGWWGSFSDCKSLKVVDLTNATELTAISDSAFSGCTSLDTVIFPVSLKDGAVMSIDDFAFENTALTSFTIPAYVTSISYYAFSGCKQLTTVEIAEGNNSFMHYTDNDGKPYDQAVYTKGDDGSVQSFVVAASTMEKITLPYNAIKNLSYSRVRTLLNNVKALKTVEIEDNPDVYAFGNCLFVKEGGKFHNDTREKYANDLILAPNSVENITLPKEFSLKCVEGGFSQQTSTFWSFYLKSLTQEAGSKLKTINVKEGNSTFMSIGGVLYEKDDYSQFWLPCAATSFTVPAQMTTDFTKLSSRLSAYQNLQKVIVEEGHPSLMSVGGALYEQGDYSKFWLPSGATSFTVPAQMTTLDFSALSANENLQEVNVEEGNSAFTTFEGALFKNDGSEFWIPSGATTLTIPAKITSISLSALGNNSSLREVKVEEGHPTYISEDGFIYDKGKTELLFAPQNATEYYAPATLEKIAENAFAVYEDDIRVANQIKNVYVENLEGWCKIQFGNPIETAEQYEAQPDGSLSAERRRAVADGLKAGYGANPMSGGANMYVREGNGWKLLENLVVDYEGELSDLAFAGCKSLRTVTVTNNITGVGEMSFAMCKNIRSISLPFVGCKKEYVMINGQYTLYSAYFYEVFGGRGGGANGTVMYDLAPETIDVITITGYNILKKTIILDSAATDDYAGAYPVAIVPWSAFQNAPVRKIIISIDETDGRDIMFGFGLFRNSTVTEVDLENSKVNASGGNVSSASIISDGSFIREITVPNTLKEIPTLFFALDETDTTLEKVIIPEGVEYLAQNDFGNLDALTLPTSIGGFWGIWGVKTVYLTGFTQRAGQEINSVLLSDTIYVATDSEAYAQLPEIAKDDDSYANAPTQKIFYQANVVFRLKDSMGNEIAKTTETHLAAKGENSKPYLKWAQTTGRTGDVYWAIDENYTLPDMVGHYKVDSTKWTLNGKLVTADTCLRGDAADYVIEQTLDAAATNIEIVPANASFVYDGNQWKIPEGMNVTRVEAIKGGNGYDYYSVGMPKDAGLYSVRAECETGYVWYDKETNSKDERTFTLEIKPASASLKWFYAGGGAADGTALSGVYEREYDGTSLHRSIYAEFTDLTGKTRRIPYSELTIYLADDRSMPVYSMSDVGLYEVEASGSGNSTDGLAWLGNYTYGNNLQQISITPRVIDLNDYNTLAWGLKGYGSLLRDGEIYIYNGTPYAYEHPELGTPDSTLSVLDSIVRVRESGNHEIEIGNIPALLAGIGAQYSATYLGNTADGVGRYTATATLTVANGNYVFGYGLGSDLKSRGMTITVNADGTALITKVWYVVKIDNGLLNPADGSEYIISDWTYGDSVTISAPRLEHGDENADGYLTNGLVHFELLRGNESIASGFGRDSFNHYINSSMPAGQYTLVCTVSNVHLGNHTHWWNNEEHNSGTDDDVRYHGFTRNFTFEVKTAEIGFTLSELTGGGYADYEWELSENKNGFFTAFETEANKNVTLASIPRAGYWAGLSETDAAKYYGSYAFTYNLLRMNNQEYFEVSDANLLNLIEGGASGTYTVYFQITALNHTPLTAMSDERYGYYFTVTVWEKVVVPTVADVEYTGNKVLPEVAESNLYEAIWTADDGYVAGGAHSVSFKLYDSVHYRWASDDVTTDTVSVSFEITKATNEWVRNPNIISWNYGGCDADINRIIAVPKFLDSEKNVLYSIVNEDGTAVKDGEGHEIAALVDFTADADGKVSDAVLAALQKLDAGVYNLVAKVEGTDNYHEKITSDTAFTILPANNEWVVTPNVIRWSYSNYDKNVNLILASARLKNNPVEFRIYSNEDLTDAHALTAWFTAPDGIVPEAVETVLKELDQGTYYLVSKVEADGNNYMGLEPEPQSFVIAKAANNWLVTPNVIQWSYGGYNVNTNLILASARYSDDRHPITFKITTDEAGEHPVAGLESFTAIDGVVANDVAEKLAAFGTGTYYLISSVTYGDGDNYTSLAPEPQEFSVTRAVNAWTVTPGVTTWIVGNYDNEEDFDAAIGRILAEARFGKVDIVITEVDNEENVVYDSANGIDNLASAGVGIYAFSARVAGTDDYSELTYAFNFKIFPKEGLPWWATLVITVGALLVAAAIIFILWKKGVFQILTGKIVLAIRTRASVDATIASVRAAKKMEEGRKSVEAAKRRERIEELQRKAAEARAMPAEERAAMLEAKAAAQAEKAEKMRSKSESMKKRAERMRNKSGDAQDEVPEATEPEATQSVTEETPVENAQQTEVAASDDRSEE